MGNGSWSRGHGMMFSQRMRVEILFPQKRGPAVQPFMPNTMVLKRTSGVGTTANRQSSLIGRDENNFLLFSSTCEDKLRRTEQNALRTLAQHVPDLAKFPRY
jgi:hypothetical protein